MSASSPIDRHRLVERHRIVLTRPHPEHVLSVGNGDFAFTTDISGMQTFAAFHDPVAAQRVGSTAVNTATMSNWGWHEMPNPDGFVLEDAMTTYETAKGPVSYPDKHDMVGAMTGSVAEDFRAGAWLNANPQRVDLGRIGFELRPAPDAEPVTDPTLLSETSQTLDLWAGHLDSHFKYEGEQVQVQTVASPDAATVAFRIQSPLLADGRARVVLRFPYASDGFFQTDDWDAGERHTSVLSMTERGTFRVTRQLDAARYVAEVSLTNGVLLSTAEPHVFEVAEVDGALDVVLAFDRVSSEAPLPSFQEVASASAEALRRFWNSGAVLDLSASTDPRALELERRVVLSQYLTRVHSSGSLPPQETGLVTNSWQGKFHLEMHLWHAAHFAVWGRPELLERSLTWYGSILGEARATAARQGHAGARWPKQTGPDGRESPDETGSLLAWQQPHIIHMLELLWHSVDESEHPRLLATYSEVVAETAAFMASFAEERDGTFHLGAPIMPAQEFYDARATTDPTFELAYWWWGLELAQQWRERAGQARDTAWQDVEDRLAAPLLDGNRYAAVATREPLRRDDHPSLLMAYGVLPATPIIDPETMRATLVEVWRTWQWATAWGWDFPVMAMTATRLDDPGLALDALLRDEPKNRYSVVGHNPQMGSILPLYLPGNGSLLLAVALLAQHGSTVEGWDLKAEGFRPFPSGIAFDPTRVRPPLSPEDPEPVVDVLTADHSIGQWLDHPTGGSVLRGFLDGTGTSHDNLRPLAGLPLRQLVTLSQGTMPESAIDALVAAAASHPGVQAAETHQGEQ